jgi:hypothetical protein
MFLVLPKSNPVLESYRDYPMYFFGGPIQGAGDWHSLLSRMLMKRLERLIIVNPSRYDSTHPDYRWHEFLNTETKHIRRSAPAMVFDRQTDWERYYMRLAAELWKTGCIIFWLATQKTERTDGQPYATDTRGELGEWRAHLMHNRDLRVVIGAEPDFPGLRVIKRNFELAVPGFPIFDSLDEVVEQAVKYAEPRLSFSERVRA